VTTIGKRITKLEDQFGTSDRKRQILLVVYRASLSLALDQDTCVQILRQGGFLPKGPIGVVNLRDVPQGLSADELRVFLRENGATTCGIHPVRDDGVLQSWVPR
jgi:hypothetical protein